MAMQYYYHGTSMDNLSAIIAEGLHGNTDKIWHVSNDEVYLWCPEKLATANCEEDEADTLKQDNAFQAAFESAQMALAKSIDCRAVVIKVCLDSNSVYEDCSCANMADKGAVCVDSISVADIVEIHTSNDLSLLRIFFLQMLHSNEYNNLDLSGTEERILKAIKNVEFYLYEELGSIVHWDKYTIPQIHQAE